MRLSAGLLAALVVFSPLVHADTILAGSDLSSAVAGTGICSGPANCQVVAQQFTVFSPVIIDEVKIIVTGPYLSSGSLSRATTPCEKGLTFLATFRF
jgi:hypothetical protein